MPTEVFEVVLSRWAEAVELPASPWWDACGARMPFAAAAVCRRWREVALATPHIWRCVFIRMPTNRTAADALWRYCRTVQLRSGSGMLDLVLRPSDSADVDDVPRQLWLVVEKEFARVQRLFVAVRGLQTRLRRLDAPNLRAVDVAVQPHGYNRFFALPRAPHLLSAQLSMIPQWEAAYSSCWDAILQMAPRAGSDSRIDAVDIRTVHLAFPLVERLTLRASTIANDGAWPGIQDASSVTRVSLHASTYNHGDHHPLSLNFPNLHTLDVTGGISQNVRVASRLCSPLVTCLSLGPCATDGTLLDLLRQLPALERLNIIVFGRTLHAAAFEGLAAQPWVCPRLAHVAMEWEHLLASSSHDTALQPIVDFVAARSRPATVDRSRLETVAVFTVKDWPVRDAETFSRGKRRRYRQSLVQKLAAYLVLDTLTA